jgi:tetratricopeptide (TPR) repeat protein
MRGGETLSAARPGGDALQRIAAFRADIIALLREKRYEETLAALYRARAETPSDLELQRGIDQLKAFLIGTYAKRLGGLDRVATPIPLSALRTPDAVLLARYIDGTSTYGDLAEMCPLGQLRTLQVLVGLYGGSEPPRVYGMEQPRIVGSEPSRAQHEPPTSGLRIPEGSLSSDGLSSADENEQKAPDTARSGAVAAVARAVQSEEERRYGELFARGTAAFVQGRYADAAESFRACLGLRPDDRGAAVMLRRVTGEGQGR